MLLKQLSFVFCVEHNDPEIHVRIRVYMFLELSLTCSLKYS